jgi:hypothetical protein
VQVRIRHITADTIWRSVLDDIEAARLPPARQRPSQCRPADRGNGIAVAQASGMESDDALRFVDADKVETPAGRLHDFVLISPTDAKLGTLDGVIVSPHERQVRYYVVKAGGWFYGHRRYLLPATPARLKSERHALQVDLEPEDLNQLARTDLHQFASFCDTDLVDTVFAAQSDR